MKARYGTSKETWTEYSTVKSRSLLQMRVLFNMLFDGSSCWTTTFMAFLNASSRHMSRNAVKRDTTNEQVLATGCYWTSTTGHYKRKLAECVRCTSLEPKAPIKGHCLLTISCSVDRHVVHMIVHTGLK